MKTMVVSVHQLELVVTDIKGAVAHGKRLSQKIQQLLNKES